MIIKEERKTSGFLSLLKGVGVLVLALMAFDYVYESNVIRQSVDSLLTAFNPVRGERIASSGVVDELSNQDLAWHAAHTYGWDCDEVVLRGGMKMDGYFPITCSNGRVLRVYPSHRALPRITNRDGGSR